MAKRNDWGAQLHNLNFRSVVANDLESAVRCLSPGAKQAFYSAAMRKGVLHKRTWNGCAYNAGGMEIVSGSNIRSIQEAAKIFQCTPHTVSKFIQAWDSHPGSDEHSTKILLELLEKVGIFSDPDKPRVVRVYRNIVVEGNITDSELLADFQKEVANLDTIIEGWAEAHNLLFKEKVNA